MDQMRNAIKSIQDQLDLKLSVEENYEHSEISEFDSVGTRSSKELLRRLKENTDVLRRLKENTDEQCFTLYSREQPRRKRLTEQANISSPHQLNRFSLVYQEKIPLLCYIAAYNRIFSCAILSDERLMIADREGLSVVNIHTGRVEQKKSLNTSYSDIAVLPDDQVAVTLPWDDKILILSTTDMSLISSIRDLNLPHGITYHQDELYVVCDCKNGPSVYILNLQGGLRRKIECDDLTVYPYTRIAVSMDAQNLYITGYKSLSRYSTQGRMIARYRFSGTLPEALTLLDDGSLLVASTNILEMIHDYDTIHNIYEDLHQGYELKLGERSVRFIGVNPVNNRIYVISNDTIKVYIMHKQGSQRKSKSKLTFETADEKLSSMKAKRKLLSFKTKETLTSVKPDMKLTPLETDKKLTSYKAEKKKLSPHQSKEKMTTLEHFWKLK